MGNSLSSSSAPDPLRHLKQPTFFLRRHGGGGIYADGAGPSGGRSMGQAPSTFDNDKSAWRLWVAFRVYYGANTIITPDDLKDDNAEALITELCRWASSRPIPFNFDENLERPPGSNNNRLVKSTTLVRYVGKVIKYFRSVDPTHPDWKDLKSMEEVPDWWTALRPLFQKEAKSFEFLYDGDGVFGTNEIKPLYQEIPPLPKIPGLAESIEDEPLRSMDQKHIFLSLVKKANDTNNNLQKLAIIHALADAIGRGGEAKFQSFRDWVFDYLWMVTNTPWKEKKTVNMYALPRVPDKRWYFDWYVIMAMYSMCEKGLYRSPSEVERGLGLVVFPLLHRMNDNNVASFVTDTLRGELPPNLQSYISSKSLRQAGCAELARHHAITLLQIIARTGHWLNMTLDSYLPPDDVARGIPAANALHGEKNLKTPVVIPRLEALGVDMPSALQLMEEMFCISIEQFQKGGDLHILVKTFAASLLMHHRQIVIDCGRTNIVSDTLLVKAEKVRITCSDSPQLPVNLVLEEWSKKIEQDFERRSKEARLSVMDEPGRESCAMIASLAAEVRMVSETVVGMKRTLDAVVVENANKTATISVLQKDNLKLRQELSLVHSREALRAQSMTSTPDGGLSKRQRTGTNSEEDATHIDFNADAVEVAVPPAVAAPPASAPAAPVVAPPTAAPAAPVAAPPAMAAAAQPAAAAAEAAATRTGIPIRYSHQADQRSKKGTVKNKPFSSVLKNMATRGLFKRVSKLKSAAVPKDLNISEPSFVTYCLELADFIAATDDDDNEFKNKIDFLSQCTSDTDDKALEDTIDFVQTRCLTMLNTLMPPSGNRAPEVYVGAMGKRVRDYKNRIKKAKNLSEKPMDINMIKLSALEHLEHERVRDVE